MPINVIPGVYYEENVTYEATGVGSKIPVFIGKTGNSTTQNYKTDGSVILTFHSKSEVIREIKGTDANGKKWEDETGILNIGNGTQEQAIANNPLAQVIVEFYEEARLQRQTDIGVPYIYVVDLGNATSKADWDTALNNVKALYDAPVEVYVGIDGIKQGTGNEATDFKIPDFISGVASSLNEVSTDLNLRYAFFTSDEIEDDDDLKTLATQCRNKITSNSEQQRLSRIGLIEPLNFGKTVARICCTPDNTEPGYFTYRSINADSLIKRNKNEALELQSGGIIFNRAEYINGDKYPKLNLCVSLSFGYQNRPADSLFHARFNADNLLREVFGACYKQVKANESNSNIAYLQTRVNKIVNDRVESEEMIKFDEKTGAGTKLIVAPSDEDPYGVVVSGQIQPVKCTIAIRVESEVRL